MEDKRLWSMSYKGYTAGVYYSEEDHVFYGEIDDIRDFVNFDSADAATIMEQFQHAVDDYISMCNEIGKTVEGGFKHVCS